jgi:hypothetical protein
MQAIAIIIDESITRNNAPIDPAAIIAVLRESSPDSDSIVYYIIEKVHETCMHARIRSDTFL